MKHILFVIDTLRMGGAEKSLISLLGALDPRKVQVDLLVFEAGGVLESQVPSWVRVRTADAVTRGMTLELRTYFPDLLRGGHLAAGLDRLRMTAASRLRRKKKSFGWGYAAPHIPELEGNYDVAVGFLEGFADFYVLDKVHAARKIGWIHTDMTGRQPAPEEADYYDRFDTVVTISQVCREAMKTVFPTIAEKIRVVENVVLPKEIRKKAMEPLPEPWDSGRHHLVTVGRLEYAKGMDIAARACKVLKDRGVNVCWHIFGQGIMQDEIAAFVAENGLEDYFRLEGLTPNPYPYLRRGDIVVQPSRWEGKSLVLDEAKILGKAIVVTRYPSVADQITDGVTGIVTGMEPESIADGICRLLEDDKLKKTLEKNCIRQENRSIHAVETFYEMIGAD